MINTETAQEKSLWDTVVSNHAQYCKVLGLSGRDVAFLTERPHPRFLRITVQGEWFSFVAFRVNGTVYGGTWQNLIMVFTHNENINSFAGRDDTYISGTTGAWHDRLLEHLRTHESNGPLAH